MVAVLRILFLLILGTFLLGLGVATVPPILVEPYRDSGQRHCQNEPEPQP